MAASYIVLARKWRPQTFADLVGQQHIAVTLQNAIAQNRVAHAFLFTGSRGVGKTSTARIFAKALNCAKAPISEPCNECQSCLEITDGHSMDVIEIDGASNRGINEIREVLDAVRYAPSRDRYKIYIIDEVHMLTTEAFNALLKTLEEPPPHVIFIFATTDPNKIPITIVSRCQRYDFKRIQTDDLVEHLSKIAKSEHIDFEESALRLIARTARGGVRDALSAMDQIIAFAEQPITGEKAAEVLGVASRETLMKMGEAIIRRQISVALDCIDHVDRYGQNLSQFSFDLLEFLRDVTIVAADPNGDVRVELNAQEKDLVKTWLPLTTFDRLQRIFNIWYQTSESLPRSLSPKLVMEMAAIRMCQVESVVPLEGILRKLDAISRAIAGNIQIAPDALEHIQEFLNTQSLGQLPAESEKKNFESIPVRTLSEPVPKQICETNPVPASPVSSPEVPSVPKSSSSPEANIVQEPARPSVSSQPTVLSSVPERTEAPSVPKSQHSSDSSVESAPVDHFDSPPDYLDDIPWSDDSDSFSAMTQEDLESLSIDAEIYDDAEDDDVDLDGEKSINPQIPKKTLEVSTNRLKNAPSEGTSENSQTMIQQRWKQVVSNMGVPLSTILSRARVDCLTRNSAAITLPEAYRNMITSSHIQQIEHHLAHVMSPSCRLSIRYDEIDDETETLAAQEARLLLEKQEAAFEQTRRHPVMQAIMNSFHIEPESIRFTFNNDRTSS